MNEAATYVVELTPAGRAAVAVVLVEGPAALPAVEQCFSPISGRPLHKSPAERIVLGRWGGAEGEELIVCRRSDERVEVHCHGGVAAVRAVVDRLVGQGCRHTSWRDWMHARGGDPIRSAARAALADAPTARTAAILLDQYHGALAAAVRAVAAAVDAADWQPAADALDDALAFRDIGLHLVAPWQVVLTGAPNVGKSSLLNALAGFQRAIVSPIPGTTRDVVTFRTAIDGWPVQLADTAGLRDAGDELEAAGVGLAGAAIADADLLIVVRDAAAADASPDWVACGTLQRPTRVIEVWNKIDLLPADRRPSIRLQSAAGDAAPLFTSAVTGEGIATLIAAIGQTLAPQPPACGAAVPFQTGQIAALEGARQAVDGRDAAAARIALQSLLSG
jgi:tRNA modification GTPase